MKFLCDRCKTRYSIGDDRVRGKILKIRCKNCANVITVREGMSDAELGDGAVASTSSASQPRRQKTTTAAPTALASMSTVPGPAVSNGRNGNVAARGGGALNAAFAAAVTKPPPALEEEWYVSIDGDQSGPFTLAEAQRWVAAKPFESELHCWSEGFDDWLPVDKVSHFRGLRKKPAPALAPPPLPRVTGNGPPLRAAMATRTVEEEPKPLFAATMASLEKAAATTPTPSVSLRGAMPSPTPTTAPAPARPSATPPGGQLAYTNGSAARAPEPKPAAITAKGTQTTAAAPLQPKPLPRSTTKPGVVAKPFGFDASEPGESATQIESPAFDDEASTTTEPVAAAARRLAPAISTPSTAVTANHNAFASTPGLKVASSNAVTVPTPAYRAPEPPLPEPDDEPSDDIDIGEVSRVVKLADLVRPAPKPIAKRSGPISSNGASNPMLGRTGSVPKMPVSSGTADGAATPDMMQAETPLAPAVIASHRRGMILLLIGAAMLIGIAIVVVALVVDGNTDQTSLGGKYSLDTERPDNIGPRPGDPSTHPNDPPVNPYMPPPKPKTWRPPINPPPVKPDPPPGNQLKADEIEAMAAKNNGTTQRCWQRAQRGVDGITLADVKKITVTMVISPDGVVTDVGLSDGHAQNKLGQCLMTAIRSWKFRTSAGGTFRFILHFG